MTNTYKTPAEIAEERAQARRGKVAGGALLAVSGFLIGAGVVVSVLLQDWRPIAVSVGLDFAAALVIIGVLSVLAGRAER